MQGGFALWWLCWSLGRWNGEIVCCFCDKSIPPLPRPVGPLNVWPAGWAACGRAVAEAWNGPRDGKTHRPPLAVRSMGAREVCCGGLATASRWKPGCPPLGMRKQLGNEMKEKPYRIFVGGQWIASCRYAIDAAALLRKGAEIRRGNAAVWVEGNEEFVGAKHQKEAAEVMRNRWIARGIV